MPWPGPYGMMGGAAGILQNSGPSPYPVGMGQIFGAGLGGLMQGSPYDEELRRQQQMQQSLGKIGQTVKAAWQSTAAPLAQATGVPMNYLANLAQSESGNRNIPQGINATGTAHGPFQFTRDTWAQVIQQHPELGLTAADRYDPAMQGKAIVALTTDNRQALTQALGRPPTTGELGLAHRFGAMGATRIIQSPKQERLRNILPTAVEANPQWQDSSVGDIINQTNSDVGGGKVQLASAAGGPIPGMAGTPPAPGKGLSLLAMLQGVGQDQGGDQTPPEEEPLGSSLQNMTPQMREIMAIALQDPVLGPHALQGLIQAGMTRQKPTAAAKAGGAALKIPEKYQEYLLGQADPAFAEATAKADRDARTALQKDTESIFGGTDSPEAKQFMKDQMMRSDPQQIAAAVAAAVQKQQATGTNEAALKDWKAVLDSGDDAKTQLDNISQMQLLNSRIHSGLGGPFKMKLLQALDAAGIDPQNVGINEKASDYEAFNAWTKLANMQARNPKEGGGMPGSMSNYEDQLLQSMGPQLTKTSEGNSLLLQYQQLKQQRRLDHAQWAQQYAAELESSGAPFGAGWFSANNKWWTSHPIINNDFLQSVANVTNRPVRAPDGATVKPLPGATGGTPIQLEDTSQKQAAPAQPKAAAPKRVIFDENGNLVPAQ